MLRTVWQEQKKLKNMLGLTAVFLFIYGLYFFLDALAAGGLVELMQDWSLALFAVHQVFNIAMALLAALMVSLSHIKLKMFNTEPKGATSIPFFSFIFGLLTFGCAPCVIAFFSAIGIAFTPIVFPHGNLLWKVILLFLLTIGFLWILRSVDKGTCKLTPSKNS